MTYKVSTQVKISLKPWFGRNAQRDYYERSRH